MKFAKIAAALFGVANAATGDLPAVARRAKVTEKVHCGQYPNFEKDYGMY